MLDVYRFHSISFPSEWGRWCWETSPLLRISSFHSISFPSEWGLDILEKVVSEMSGVSIQLVSPASGDPSI